MYVTLPSVVEYAQHDPQLSLVIHKCRLLIPIRSRSKDDGVAVRSELVTVSLSVCVMYRVLHHSIERDKELTVDIKNVIVSDNQWQKFIKDSFLG